jgi:large subunit ribosomal protein L32
LTPTSFSNCSHCGEPKLPHRLCAGCGTYKGRTVIKLEDELQ